MGNEQNNISDPVDLAHLLVQRESQRELLQTMIADFSEFGVKSMSIRDAPPTSNDLSVLVERGLVDVRRNVSKMRVEFTVSDLGRRVAATLTNPIGPLNADDATAILRTRPQFPTAAIENRDYIDADASWTNFDAIHESAWENAQAVAGRWIDDVLDRVI